MGKLSDKSFYTKDYDQEMLDYVKDNYLFDLESSESLEWTCLYYSSIDEDFNKMGQILQEVECLTKQQFKEKIGMIDKAEEKDNMVSYKLINKEGFLKESAANSSIVDEIGSDIFIGQYLADCLVDTDYRILIGADEFRFFEKVDNNAPAEPLTKPVAELDDELKMLPYQHLIDDCKELDINLVVTGEGLYVLDCINSIEYKIEEPDDYQKIVDAMRLLQNKEMG